MAGGVVLLIQIISCGSSVRTYHVKRVIWEYSGQLAYNFDRWVAHDWFGDSFTHHWWQQSAIYQFHTSGHFFPPS